ncbi:MAG TPA: cobalamin-binding protein [Longimicrobium sp.]
MARPRVVSLLPAATEMVCALGLERLLVGRSHACDFPGGVRRLPACTSPRLDPTAPAARLDDAVKTLAQQGGGLYQIDGERLRALQPAFILTQAQCEVCAVSLAEVQSLLAEWPGARPEVIALSPARLSDLWDDLARVAQALGAEERGRQVVRELKGRVADVIVKVAPVERRPSVACLEWLEPLMAAGNWVPELVELAGGRNLFGEAGRHSPWLDWNALCQRDPEILIAMPCGYDLARTMQEMPALAGRLGWSRLRAVRQGRVFVADGSQYFNRPGPRLVDSLEMLAGMLHPAVFTSGHEGKGWRRWATV